MAPAFFVGLATLGPLSPNIRVLQGEEFGTLSPSQRQYGNGGGGKGEEGEELQPRGHQLPTQTLPPKLTFSFPGPLGGPLLGRRLAISPRHFGGTSLEGFGVPK